MKNRIEEIANTLEFLAGRGKEAYLVGGFVRDIIDGKISTDVDIVIKDDPIKIAKEISELNHCAWFPLDEERKIIRVVIKKQNIWNIDISPLFGDIKTNLLERDFTVDAIALKINEWKNPQNFIDPTDGIEDLKKRIVRMTSVEVFSSDPLRLIRAFRIAAQINGKIDEKTILQIKKDASLIKRVAGERIKDEIFKILSCENSSIWIEKIFKAGLFFRISKEFEAFSDTPQHYYHKGGLFEHSIETLKSFEKILRDDFKNFFEFKQNLREYFTEKRIILTKIACLFHDIGKPLSACRISGRLRFFGHERNGKFLTRNIMRRLKASFYETNFVCEAVYSHMRPANLSSRATKRAFFRFFNSFRTDAHIATLFVSLCDRMSYDVVSPQPKEIAKQMNFTREILKFFYIESREEKKPPLVNGWDIMENLKIPPSRLVGLLLKGIREVQAEGIVKTKEEAIEFAKKIKDKIFLYDATIIIPAYNEEKTIELILKEVKQIPHRWEVLVVDDGSKDRTVEIVRKHGFKVISHKKNQGKGEAIKTGIKNALGKYIAIQDADLEYKFSELKFLIELALEKELPAVYGSRFLKKNPYRYLSYYLGNRFLSFVIGLLFFKKVTDAYTCYKVVSARILKKFSFFSRGFEIESEITSRLLKAGVKITEVPISYRPRGFKEGKKIRPLDAVKGIWAALKVRVGC